MAIIDVVKYNGGPDVFAWKFPNEELGTWTQLIVNESQEAILVKSGQVFDVFGAGRHTLDTANIPLLNKIVNLPFGGRSPFTAEVWFINKAYNLDVKWGTPSPIQLQDPRYGIFVPVRANGAFGIRIENSKKFLIKLVGTMRSFAKTDVTKYFRSLYVTKVKDSISSYLVHKKISILEINAYIDELSNHMKEAVQPTMLDYGIEVVSFYVNEISVPENDESVIKLKKALSKRAEMDIIGYSYQQERSFDTLETAASNEGSGSLFMGAGLGLGMGKAVGQSVGGLTNQLNVTTNPEEKECPKCHSMIPNNQRFCGVCGYDTEMAEKKSERVKLRCSACGNVLSKKDNFCPECGRKLNLCPKCGTDIPDDSKECPECGYKVPIPCPHCGALVPQDTKFCPECGHSLIKKCPKCGTKIEGNPKFCPECGERL